VQTLHLSLAPACAVACLFVNCQTPGSALTDPRRLLVLLVGPEKRSFCAR
jgi:hypothetical protein